MPEPRRLQSYVCGAWRDGAGEGALVRDAATGAPVARVDSGGLDFGESLAYGRARRQGAARRSTSTPAPTC